MVIKEIKFDENDEETGIQAISFVTNPAIEKDFVFFSKDNYLKSKGVEKPKTHTMRLLDPVYGYKFWKISTVNNQSLLIDTSHDFCKKHAGKVFSIDQIHKMSKDKTAKYNLGWKDEDTYCDNFAGIKESRGFKLDNQIFNCRHFFEPVRDIKDVPDKLLNKMSSQSFSIDFKTIDDEKKCVKGVAMIPEQLIYRRDEMNNEFYVYFSIETVAKLQQKYGFNREITIQHQDNITGNAIMMNSWIYDGKNDDCGYTDLKVGSWCVEYKILNDNLWQLIKDKNVKGFSVELITNAM